jgi:predicted peptidase
LSRRKGLAFRPLLNFSFSFIQAGSCFVKFVSKCLFLFLLGGLPAIADEVDVKVAYEPRVFQNCCGKKLNYRLLKPAPYDPSKCYPLVVLLHGAGECGDDNVSSLLHGTADFTTEDNRKNFPCFVVVPQCPKGFSWWNSKRKPDMPDTGPTEPVQRVVELLDTLPHEFSIDCRRLYVTGYSMGGYGTWDLIQRYPEKFAAAAPICGGGDDNLACRLVQIPIWVFHGAADTGNQPDISRKMVAAIRQAGGKPLYTEYPGVGHNSWAITYKNPLFMTWLFSQSLEY